MITIIGKSGQLASELQESLSSFEKRALGRHDIDLMSHGAIATALDSHKPAAIINASAYTAVDKAEYEKEAAYALNSTAVKNLGEYCASRNIHLVQVSTDYVFNGTHSSPISTEAPRQPLGVYGASKAAGEEALEHIEALSYCIIRTAWVYSVFGNNFVHTMLRLMAEKPQLRVVADQIGSPTWAKGLAAACIFAAERKVSGIHHWTDLGVASWYDFAVAIQRIGVKQGLLNTAIPIQPITTADFPTPAARPAYSVLDKQSLTKVFAELPQDHWENQLEKMMTDLVK
ncbi:dTDP-4-dehydrorhamnose reductase [Alteromonas pelagimontana]|uniref:dTDP-4-dehydrorhamnose reductase n=1 Tax=Alteromonas pelagimontana TaxID=1858656 RepID=A0A6M4MGL7_9ALTE|nr:dTDP-4-dehydrorhamnose reductase [Alteromonas pelagimontana]QJR81745.1 dTDP-4-dehydrorhamnose reductase [Alteromonas pelagimontana]